MMGEWPTRPGIFQAKPLVVVTPDISPLVLSARQLIVPVGGRRAISNAQARVALSADGNIASSSPLQFVCPRASRSDRFHTSHASRDFSVSRLSSAYPKALANRNPPSPASIIWSDSFITSLAILDGVLMPRMLAPEPARRVGPCITHASSSTTPSSFGNPP